MKDETKISKNKPCLSAGREKKQQIVAELSEKVAKAKALVFTNFQGMTNVQIEGLKKTLKKVDAELMVAKNTLLFRSLENEKLKIEDKKSFEGPTATLFAYSDPIAAIKELAKTIRKLKLPVVKFGILEEKLLTEAEISRLSTLPSREQLIAQVVYGMKAPIYGLHRALNWNLQKLVLTLKAIEKSKP